MCTVTFIPYKEGFVLTSNRDELAFRETHPPQKYRYNDVTLCYPKDALAGGSWIAINNRGRTVCLLNGAYVAHSKKDFHTYSRGKVLLEAAASFQNTMDVFSTEGLQNTEPFTLLCIDFDNDHIVQFSELIWDGISKHYRILDATKEYIWSSVTLYDEESRNARIQWFRDFLEACNHQPGADALMNFHAGQHSDNKRLNVVMEREGGLKTVSTTQVRLIDNGLSMRYIDLQKGEEHTAHI